MKCNNTLCKRHLENGECVKLAGEECMYEKAKDYLKEYVRLSLQEDKDMIANIELFKNVEQFIEGENIILEDAQVGNSPFDADEVFNKEMKAYPDEK